MKNIDKVKKWILDHSDELACGPKTEKDKERVRLGDSMFIRNLYLLNRKSRRKLAESMGLPDSRCSFCWKSGDLGGSSCVHYTFPLNYCSREMLNWLELDEDQEIPEEWKSRDERERTLSDKERSTKEKLFGIREE